MTKLPLAGFGWNRVVCTFLRLIVWLAAIAFTSTSQSGNRVVSKMPGRTIAIGDIHGCSHALAAVVEAVDPQPDDLIITLGDYVDRGPDSRGVIEQLIRLSNRCRLIALRGNHEEMMLAAMQSGGGAEMEFWLACGGDSTLASYGGKFEYIPAAHRTFLKYGRLYYETARHLFMHAGYLPDIPIYNQPAYQLLWATIRDSIPAPHCSGKIAIVGHTSQKSGDVLDVGHLKCIDTYCHGGGWLTAIEVETGHLWQANAMGMLRDTYSTISL